TSSPGSAIGSIDGDTQSASTPRSLASATSAVTSAGVASGLSGVWSMIAATAVRLVMVPPKGVDVMVVVSGDLLRHDRLLHRGGVPADLHGRLEEFDGPSEALRRRRVQGHERLPGGDVLPRFGVEFDAGDVLHRVLLAGAAGAE